MISGMSQRGFTTTNEKRHANFFAWRSSKGGAKLQRGFTLMIAVLMGSILLAIGSAIYNILSKEVLFSASGRESQFAFYAADAGIECTLYQDYTQDAFKMTGPPATVTCNAQTVPVTRTFDAGTGTYTSTFDFSLGAALTDPCVSVTVRRSFSPTRTTIEAAGHNTCVIDNPRRIERSIRITY
jgi:Tfp pilus assembly protein PilX